MAKYNRHDPRNRKKNRHKDKYLGRVGRPTIREPDEDDKELIAHFKSFSPPKTT